ncbi:MAG: outer membrane beta-barrel protein [Muribaculaceae bacterium]
MKRKLISIMIVLASVLMSGNVNAESRWGVVAGANINEFPAFQKGVYKLYDADRTVGGTIGINGEMFFPGIGMGVDASLLYNFTQAKLHLGEQPLWSQQGVDVEKMTMHVLEIPFNLKYRYINMNGFENKLYPFVFAGPNINIMLGNSDGGNMKYSSTVLGLHVGFGVELMRKFQISASHEWGVSQMFKTKLLDDNAHKMRTWHIRATYFF